MTLLVVNEANEACIGEIYSATCKIHRFQDTSISRFLTACMAFAQLNARRVCTLPFISTTKRVSQDNFLYDRMQEIL